MNGIIYLQRLLNKIRSGKVDSLFPISHFLDFEAGGRSLFIIDSKYYWKSQKEKSVSESHANKRVWHIERAIMKVEAAGF